MLGLLMRPIAARMISISVAVGGFAMEGRPMLRWFGAFMKFRALQGWLPLFAALVVIGVAFDILTRSRLQATTATQCQGDYADTIQIQNPHTREIEQGPRGQYS